MAEEEQVFTEVMSLLEAEPSSGPAGGVVADLTAPRPDIPALCEQLAVLVSTGKAKDAIGVHEQVKHLSDKDVEKYAKRYETCVSAKTTDSLIDSCIFLVTKVVGMAVNVKLRNDYIINKELSNLAGNLALKCRRFLVLASVAMITTKHIDLNSKNETKLKEKKGFNDQL